VVLKGVLYDTALAQEIKEYLTLWTAGRRSPFHWQNNES
jgi:hypothetical protein